MNKYRFQINQIKKLLKYLGSPHLKIPVICIAGTNGKGSTAYILMNILSQNSAKCGMYISPHIFNFRERISINGKNIPLSRFKKILTEIRKAQKQSRANITKFEIITAAAILYFYQEKCDYCIMEAGLGGRLDATNVCENKIVSVITPISFEHTKFLGDTIEKIAIEKAGITKKNGILVDGSGVEKIREIGLKRKNEVYTFGKEFDIKNIEPFSLGKYCFSYISEAESIPCVCPGLKGKHQCINASLAVTAALAARECDVNKIKEGIKETNVPGRLEMYYLNKKNKIFVDAAHNPGAMKTVKEFFQEWLPEGSSLFLIMGVYKDKDFKTMAREIYPLVKKVWTFTPKDKRALDGEKLCKEFKEKAENKESFDDCFNKAVESMNENDWLLVCGSFSVVKPGLKKIKCLNLKKQ
ncbi:MAG: bifunctional folylpolyglutamate synthase/dihydrofolate synthase [Elusimicrobiota bacterium]